MLFDSLLGLVERGYLPSHVARVVTNSRLFVFPGRAHEVLAEEKSATDEEVAELNEHFRLPFDTVAIEDSASLVIIADSEEEQAGLGGPRFYIEVEQMIGARSDEFVTPARELPQHVENMFRGTINVTWGNMFNLTFDPKRYSGNHLHAHFRYEGHGCYEKKQGLRRDLMPYLPADYVGRNAANNVLTAIAELDSFNQPNHWILEETPARPRREGKVRREPRSHERPRYTLLKPEQIREKLGLPDPGEEGGTSPTPHERRGHWRTYRHERFAASGLASKRRWIKATWVGPSEAVIGKRRYKVCLDL